MIIKHKNELLYYRKKYNHAQEQVVKKLSLVSTSRLSNWEQGKSLPSLPNLFKLCKLYRVTSEKLYPSLNKKVKKKKKTIESVEQAPTKELTEDEQMRYLASLVVGTYFHLKKNNLPSSDKLENERIPLSEKGFPQNRG
jgi:transcriptional regulator with XRE-family HTH domain